MQQKILIWDNDGTITGSINPNNTHNHANIILTNVKKTMQQAEFNLIISGFKSLESEAQNFDFNKIIVKFKK